LGYVFDTIREVKRALNDRVPVIGFAGTPWTVAAYMVEGGTSKHYPSLLGWSHSEPAGLAGLLEKIADTSREYLLGQIEAGAQALQVFDTWGGLLDAERFRSLALPALLRMIDGLRDRVPLIYYGQGIGHLMPILRELPIDVLSVDWRVPLDQVRAAVGPTLALQGNLDPTVLLAPPEKIEQAVGKIIAAGRGGSHVVNLGHGILPMTPVEHARAFVEAAKDHGRRIRDHESRA
jgi:uroporphyrinogen decarboxylase